MMKLRACLLVVAVGCSSHPAPETPAARPSPERPPVADAPATPAPPELRLPADVAKPTRQAVELTIDPASEDFTGTTTIELDVAKPTRLLWLNALEITVDHASVKAGAGDIAATPIVPKGKDGYLGLAFASELPAGKATLAIAYRGKAHRNVDEGLYTISERDDWYAFTQFENTSARQAFPCFDEPSFKIPWKIAIHTRKPLVALANTNAERETDEPNGMKLVTFAETKPLPSYLVAFAVGPFEAIEAGKTKAGAPIRIVVPKGRAGDAEYPVKNTKRILDALEDYFGIPYPYPKLDAIAVPNKRGAMENPGLITYSQSLIVTKPADMTRARQEQYLTVAAHEMAHQWFGDLVTMAWWDDTWLNESFASWMESKISAQIEKGWEGDIVAVDNKDRVMGDDSLDNARQIRQPIVTADDIANSFDSITYEKGEAVLRMIERHITPHVFQKGVRAYLAKHAWGNATYDDFVRAMSEASGTDQKPLFDAFVLQSGVPLVTAKLECAKGDKPKLVTSMRRYKPIGSKIDPKRTWVLPMCVRWGTGNATGRDCALLTGEAGEVALSAKTCPEWLLPNDSETGYYRALPEPKLLAQLLAHFKALTLAERDGLAEDLVALVRSGDVPADVVLRLVPELAKESNRHLVGESVDILLGVDRFVSDALRPAYQRFIVKTYGPRAKAMGWQSKPGEDDNTKRLRATLLQTVGRVGDDKATGARATELTWKWFDNKKAIEPELVNVVTSLAARHADQKLFDKLVAEAKATKDRDDRSVMGRALGSVTDPKLVEQAERLGMTQDFDLRERFALLTAGMREPQTRDATYAFVKAHYDEIAASLPPGIRQFSLQLLMPVCDKDRIPEIDAFFKPRAEKFDGGARVYKQVVEEIQLCDAQKRAQTPAVEQFLEAQ